MAPDRETVHKLATELLMTTAASYPDITPAEMLSAVLTVARGLITVVMDHGNTPHNRAEILRVLGELEGDVWERAPKTEIQ